MAMGDPTTSRFSAVIESARGGGAGVVIPPEVVMLLGGRVQMRVTGTLNGVPYQSSTMPGPWGLFLGVHRATREAAGVAAGDLVEVEVMRDDRPRLIDIPPALEDAFVAEPALRDRFEALAFTWRKEMAASVSQAKRPETRERRLAAALARLRAQ